MFTNRGMECFNTENETLEKKKKIKEKEIHIETRKITKI